MDRIIATALIDQLCRELPSAGTGAEYDFDYAWFRERISKLANQCCSADVIYLWRYALWHLDLAGLLPEGVVPTYRA